MHYLWLIVALTGLWLGTELAVRGAVRFAARKGLSQVFVGMTILAIGTDIPEMVIAVMAALQRLNGVETSGIVLGGAVGSCLGQISLVLGIAGLIGYLTIGRRRIWMDGIMVVGSIVLLFLVGLDGKVTRVEGGILLTTYVIYFGSLLRRERRHALEEKRVKVPGNRWRDITLCLSGLAVVAACSHLTVTNAIALAEIWGVGQTVVGIFLVGLATSLPELALSVTAVFQKAGSLSVGNVLGSNIFDMLVPPGAAALIAGLEVTSKRFLWMDLPVLLALTMLAFAFFLVRKGLQKREALILLVAYLVYAVFRSASA